MPPSSPFAAAFYAALPEPRPRPGDAVELNAQLERMYDAARTRYPLVDVEPGRYVAHLVRKLDITDASGSQTGPSGALAALHAEDLYLACACEDQAPSALACFRDAVVPDLAAALRYLGMSPAVVDETTAETLALLFTGPSPRIATYAGRGPIRGWVRAIGVRLARRLIRKDSKGGGSDEALAALPDRADSPELRHLKALYRPEVERALREAMGALPPRDRTLIGQRYLDGLNIDQLAALYGVHRATVARWLVAARDALLHETRQRLRTILRASSTEVDSIVRLVRSDLQLSLRQVTAVP